MSFWVPWGVEIQAPSHLADIAKTYENLCFLLILEGWRLSCGTWMVTLKPAGALGWVGWVVGWSGGNLDGPFAGGWPAGWPQGAQELRHHGRERVKVGFRAPKHTIYQET